MEQENVKPIILDLGCGKNKKPGAIGLDNVALEGVDIVHDLLDFPYPFESESVQRVVMIHVLEHFVIEDIIKIMGEVHRILRQDGDVIISVPHAGSVDAFSDPTHKSFFTYRSFLFFTLKYDRAYYKVLVPRWQMTGLWTSINLVCDSVRPPSRWCRKIASYLSKGMNWLMRRDKSLTISEVMVKALPVWLVNIHCRLVKTSSLHCRESEKSLQEGQWPFGIIE